MKDPLNILHLEDNFEDASLIEAFLETEEVACKITRVAGRHDFRAALSSSDTFDLIISDFTLPQFDGLSALGMAREQRPEVPFIFLSGTIGEELAVEALREGATDYVLKDRLARLPSAIERAVHDAQEREHRRKMEEELRRSEERFQLAVRATQDVVWDLDLVTNQGWRNENFEKQFGYGPGKVMPGSDAWRTCLHPDDRERVESDMRAAIEAGAETWLDEYRFLRADGSVANVLDRVYIVRDANNRAVRMIGALMDISKRRESDERIREQAALLDHAQEAICVNNMSQNILYWNKGAERLYGWTSAEALGWNANDLLFQGDLSGPQEALRNLIRSGEWQGELHQVTKDGHKLVIESRWTLLRDQRGEPKSILVMNVDISERKRLEAEHLRSQRVETIGALAGGIAHDLNNALTPVLMGVNLLRQEKISPDGMRMLELMGKGAVRCSDMVRQILSFSRGVGGTPTLVRIRELVEEMVRLAETTFPRTIKIETVVAPGIHTIRGNPTQLHQVLLNLCINARDAMPEGGTLTIEAENGELGAGQLPVSKDLKPGRYVIIRVIDTGHGIAPELLGKIFEPFFTTKELGRGTGLGLSTVVGIVKTHGGFLDVVSTVGSGTNFKVCLPALLDQPA